MLEESVVGQHKTGRFGHIVPRPVLSQGTPQGHNAAAAGEPHLNLPLLLR